MRRRSQGAVLLVASMTFFTAEESRAEIVILESVSFEPEKAELDASDREFLDRYASTLIANPHVLRVLVAGEADDKVSSKKNITLSLKRATVAVEYMEKKGVPQGVLVAAGFGDLCLASWKKGTDRARSIEFKILETDSGCTHVEFACQAAVDEGLVPKALEKYLPGGEQCLDPGFLSVNVSPPGIVFVDGEEIGWSPVLDRRVASGQHKVAIINELLGMDVTYSVVVSPGKHAVIIKSLLEEAGKFDPGAVTGKLTIDIKHSYPVGISLNGQNMGDVRELEILAGIYNVKVWTGWFPSDTVGYGEYHTLEDYFPVVVEHGKHLVVHRVLPQGAAFAPQPVFSYTDL